MKPLIKLTKKVKRYPHLERKYLHSRIPREEYPVCPRCKTNRHVVYMDANWICLKPVNDKWGGKKENGCRCWYHINDNKLSAVKATECHICGSKDIYPGRNLCRAHYIERQKIRNRIAKEERDAEKLRKTQNMKRLTI